MERDDYDIPFCAQHVWVWFWEMDTPGERLTCADINAWCALNEVKLASWELVAIREMDNARIEWRRKPESEKKMVEATPEMLKEALRMRMKNQAKQRKVAKNG